MDLGRLGRTWVDLGKLGWTFADLSRLRWTWVDLGVVGGCQQVAGLGGCWWIYVGVWKLVVDAGG